MNQLKVRRYLKNEHYKNCPGIRVPERDLEEFFSDMGVKEQYDAQEVLLWSGY
ncbi:hypothetical protein ACLB1E_35155 [Escherichia coli]